MQKLKENLPILASITLILLGCITVPAFAFINAMNPGQSDLKQFVVQQNAETREFVQGLVGGDKIQDVIAELQPLQVIKQKPPATKKEPLKTALNPVPDPLVMEFERLGNADSQILQQLSALEHRLNSMLAQTAMKQPAVDRMGNTQEQLDDIFQDVEVPVLPDAMAKGLAKYPGSRVLNHPETGTPVLVNAEWVVTRNGGLHELVRHKGVVRPITIRHQGKTPTPPPQPEPFRLSLGNN